MGGTKMSKIVKKMIGVLLAITVVVFSVMYSAYPAQAAYIYPYGVYKATGIWKGMKLDYEFASEPSYDFITVYWKGDRDYPILSRKLKKVKENQYRTQPYKNDKKHYFTVKVYKKKIVLKEVGDTSHYTIGQDEKVTFKKVRTLQLP